MTFGNFAEILSNYTTALHSINVMALAIGYASHENYSLAERKSLGLAALLHGVGKGNIDLNILSAPRKLTNDDRPYRNAIEPFKAMSIIRDDVLAGKFNRKVF